MSFSQLEARIAAQYTVDTEAQRKAPKGLSYKHVRYDMDGLVHRVTNTLGFDAAVHDEVTLDVVPWTGCGIPLPALAHEGAEDPEKVGFCHEGTSLTCMTCASGLTADGDIHRMTQKNMLFGAAYGLKSSNIMQMIGRQAGKSNLLRQLVKYQQFNAMVLGYAAHDAANVLGYGQAMFLRKRRYDASFMHRLARMALSRAP